MLSQNDKYISDASETIYQLTQEESIRLQCEAREDYYKRKRSTEIRMERLLSTNKELTATVEKQDSTIAELTSTIAALKAAMEANGITVDN